MDVLTTIFLIIILLFYVGPWIAKKLLLWQLRKMQRRAFDAFNQRTQQQETPQSPRSKYADVEGSEAKYEEITTDEPANPSCTYTPTGPKVTDARWEEIP